ncbi:hypothetical protein [Sphingomonas panacis]|nr:hypothetical protein [Sphingomonas panacis]
MLVDAIFEYLIAIGGPDRGTWRLWLAITLVGIFACVLIAAFRVR